MTAKDRRLYGKFTLDFADHPKIMPLSDEAFRCLVEATLWSRQQMTDGFLAKRYVVARWSLEVASELCANDPENPSLIEVEGGYLIHDFAEHQTTLADIERTREARKAAGRKGGLAKAASARKQKVANGKQVAKQTASKTCPETETETEINRGSSNAAASRSVTREQPQQHDDDLPPEPDLPEPPEFISASPKPAPQSASSAARALVRSTVPASLPRSVRDQLACEVDRLRRDPDVDPTHIAEALAVWGARPGAGPKLLPNLVADAARSRAAPAPKPSSKLRGVAELAAQARAEEVSIPSRRELA